MTRPGRVTAVVTGGGSGIGAATARRLRATGHDVVVWDVNGGDITCDISDPAAIADAMRTTVERHGVPTRVVACAAIGASGLLVDETVDHWGRVLSVNLTGTWLTLQAAAREMIAEGLTGSMVAVSSISGTLADPSMGAYCVSKAGVDMLVRVAAAEWGELGIRVNAVGPGVTRTPMFAKPEQIPGWAKAIADRTALRRVGEADEVAEAIVGTLEMTWVTGQVIHADGGLANHSPIDVVGHLKRLAK